MFSNNDTQRVILDLLLLDVKQKDLKMMHCVIVGKYPWCRRTRKRSPSFDEAISTGGTYLYRKQCILSESRFDFLKDLVKSLPDVSCPDDEVPTSPETAAPSQLNIPITVVGCPTMTQHPDPLEYVARLNTPLSPCSLYLCQLCIIIQSSTFADIRSN